MNKVNTTAARPLFLGCLGVGLGLLTHRHTLQAKEAAAQKTDKDYFVGTWKITKARAGGKEIPAEIIGLSRFIITKDGKVNFQVLEENKEGHYKLPAAGQIDIALGQTDLSPGIYKFDGENRLTICFSFSSGDKRPTAFSSEQGSKLVLLVLQRSKPGEEKLTPQELEKYKESRCAKILGVRRPGVVTKPHQATNCGHSKFRRHLQHPYACPRHLQGWQTHLELACGHFALHRRSRTLQESPPG